MTNINYRLRSSNSNYKLTVLLTKSKSKECLTSTEAAASNFPLKHLQMVELGCCLESMWWTELRMWRAIKTVGWMLVVS